MASVRRDAWRLTGVALGLGAGLVVPCAAQASPPANAPAPRLTRTLAGAGSLIGFLPGGQTILTLSADGTYTIRNWRTGAVSGEYWLGGQLDDALLRGGRRFLLYRDGDLAITDAVTGREVGSIRTAAGRSRRLLWVSRDESQAAVGASGKPPTIYDLRTGHAVKEMGSPNVLAMSPDGALVVSSEGSRVVAKRAGTGRPLASLHLDGSVPRAVAFSADGAKLAVWYYYEPAPTKHGTGYVSEIFLLDTRSGKTKRISQRGDPPWLYPGQLAFSAGGRWLAGGGVPDTALIWQLPAGRQLGAMRGHELGSFYSLSGLAFSPDGRYLAVGFWEGDVGIYELPGPDRAPEVRRHSTP